MAPQTSPTRSGQSVSYRFDTSPVHVYTNGLAVALDDAEVQDLTESSVWGTPSHGSPPYSKENIKSTAKTNGGGAGVARRLMEDLQTSPSASPPVEQEVKTQPPPSSPTQCPRQPCIQQGADSPCKMVSGHPFNSPRPSPARHRLSRVSRPLDMTGTKWVGCEQHADTEQQRQQLEEEPKSAVKRRRLLEMFTQNAEDACSTGGQGWEPQRAAAQPVIARKLEECNVAQRRSSIRGNALEEMNGREQLE